MPSCPALSRRTLLPFLAALLLPAALACQPAPPFATLTPTQPSPVVFPSPAITPSPLPSPVALPTPTPTPTPSPTPAPVFPPAEMVSGVPRFQTLALAGTEPRSLDPALSQDTTTHLYVSHIFSGLVRLEDGVRLEPDLAQSWDTLDGGTRYRFHLRRDALFHSGRQVTAHDVAYSLERASSPDLGSPTAAAYLSDILGLRERLAGEAGAIAGLRVVDDYTLEITIDAPKAYFLAKLAYPVAFVVDRLQVEAGPGWQQSPNGTGPFQLKAWEQGQHLLLERAPGHYRPSQGVRYVAFRFLAGPPLRLYEEGQIDAVEVGGGSLSRVLDPGSGLADQLRAYGEQSIHYIGFNTARPPFDDPLVRRAFVLALDRTQLIGSESQESLLLAGGLLPPGMPGYPPATSPPPYDPAEARRLLAQSSYGGPQGLPPIVYTASGLDSVPGHLGAMAELWRANLGVQVSVRLLPPDEYFTRLAQEVDNLFDYGWIADYPDPENVLDTLFHSGSAYNVGRYQDPQVDALLEEARTEPDHLRRTGLYAQAQQLLLAGGAAFPLWHGVSYVLVKPYVQGYALTPQGIPTLEKVWFGT
ncbi:MAG: peptide ABC transporter substrate-binding protein [Chloroflexi bacterium]|nr:peptide ABC transporter substrate-binding protein [Chloroflexota bacterium]